jgi:hypothetical protein
MMVVLGHGSYLPNLNFTMPHLNFSLPQFNLPSIFGSGKVEDRNDGPSSLQGIWNNNIEVSFFVALASLLKILSLEMLMAITASFISNRRFLIYIFRDSILVLVEGFKML